MHIELDNREHHLQAQLEALQQQKWKYAIPEISVKVSQLALGDIAIYHDEKLAIVIERKTVADICASIIDGRFREQRERLLQLRTDSDGAVRIIYLIEGAFVRATALADMLTDCRGGLATPTVMGAISNLLIRDSVEVLHTNSVEESAILLCKMYHSFVATFVDTGKATPRLSSYKKKRADTPADVLLQQLQAIPGVGPASAMAVAQNYTSMRELCEALASPDCFKTIANMRVSEKQRVGDVCARKIISMLSPETELPESPQKRPKKANDVN